MTQLTPKSVILGEPATPRHQVNPLNLVRLLEQLDTKASLTGNMYFVDTKAELDALTGVENDDTGFVLADTLVLSGVYRRVLGAWQRTSALPAGFTNAVTGKTGFVILRQTFLPGDVPQNFTSSREGSLEDTGIVPGETVSTVSGSVLQVTGESVVATRERVRLVPGRRYSIEWSVRRETNPTDPSGDTVRLGIYWLDGQKNLLSGGNQIVDDITLTTGMGVQNRRRFVLENASGYLEIEPPEGAAYFVPYVETFGLDGVTDIIQLGWDVFSRVARTFYVTMDGSDTNDGASLTTPLATIGEALTQASLAGAPCVILVHPGEYLVKPDTEIPENCAIYGYDLRVTKLILSNAGGTAPAAGTARRNNMFLMNSGIKARGFTLTGMEHEPYTIEGGPPNKGWGFVFKSGAFIIRSPYVADCSVLHDFTQDQLSLPIDKAAGNPLMPLGCGNILADGSVLARSSPLRSVVVDSFTAINPNGVGYAIKRNGFVQLVSVFTNWSRIGLWTHQGGQVTVANSNNTFGDFALVSSGFRNTIKIDGVSDPSLISVQTAAGNLVSSQTESIVTQLMTVRYPTMTGWNNLTEDQKELTERDTRTLLRSIVNDFRSGQDRGVQFFTKGLFDWNAQYHFATSLLQIFLDSWEQVRLELGSRISGQAALDMLDELIAVPTTVVSSPAEYRVSFPSVIEATGQQFSFAGTGVNYSSLPFSQRGTGEAPDPRTAILKLDGGKVFATFATEAGDTYLGEDLRVDFERNTIEGQSFSRGVQNIALPLIIGIGG